MKHRPQAWIKSRLLWKAVKLSQHVSASSKNGPEKGHPLHRVIVLEDDDVVHLCAGRYGIFNAGHQDRGSAVPRELQTLEMEVCHLSF